MVQTRNQRRNARNNLLRRYAARLRAANSTRASPLINSLNGRRRALEILNASQRIALAYRRYRRYRTARMAMNRRLPSELSRRIASYL